tara:strand:- start:104 stop:1183 length:1080 start_codon:yes stop_codon:yes gene_type:complete
VKNLAIYIPSIESGGVEKNLFNIANYLSNRNINVYIITANNNKKKDFNSKIKFISPNNNTWNNRSRFIKSLICFFLFIFKVNKSNLSILSFQSNLSAIILAKIFFLKIIIRLNTSLDKYIEGVLKKLIFKIIYNLSNNIIVNSIDFKKNLKKILKLNSTIIFNPTDFNKKFKKKKIKYFRKFKGIKILSIGRLTSQKDQMTILKSLNILKNKINFKFFLIGRGDEIKKLKMFVLENKISKKVKFGGYVKNAHHFMNSADLFILSSKFEGLPNVLIEAQSQGIPIVSSDCSTGPKEILLSGKLGELFKVGDYVRLSEIIIKYSKNKSFFLKKTTLAKKYLYRYDYYTNLNKYYNTIRTIL